RRKQRNNSAAGADTRASMVLAPGEVAALSAAASAAENSSNHVAAAPQSTTFVASNDLVAAKRKSTLKAYVAHVSRCSDDRVALSYLERFERLESLFVLPDLPPLSIPVPVPQVVSATAVVEELPKP